MALLKGRWTACWWLELHLGRLLSVESSERLSSVLNSASSTMALTTVHPKGCLMKVHRSES